MDKELEKREDFKTGNTLFLRFCENFCDKNFPHFELYQGVQFRDYLEYGVNAIFVSEVSLPIMTDKAKNKAGLSGDKIKGMFWINSEINPNGVVFSNDIGRTFSIEGKFYGKKKYNQKRWEDNGIFLKYYDYARDIDSVIENFKDWVNTDLKNFVKVIENKEYHWDIYC